MMCCGKCIERSLCYSRRCRSLSLTPSCLVPVTPSGRGASINNFAGNLRWRELIKDKRQEYLQLPKLQRHIVSDSIVFAVRNMDPPGRFLQQDPVTGLWHDIGDQRANEKTAQALREGAHKLRNKIGSAGIVKDPTGPVRKPPSKHVSGKKKSFESEPLFCSSSWFPSLPPACTEEFKLEARAESAAGVGCSTSAPADAGLSLDDKLSLELGHRILGSADSISLLQSDDNFYPDDLLLEPLPLEVGNLLPAHSSDPSFPPAASLVDAQSLAHQQRLGNNDHWYHFWSASDLEPNAFPPNCHRETMAGITSIGFPSFEQASFHFSKSTSCVDHAGTSFLHAEGRCQECRMHPSLEEQDRLLSDAADLIFKVSCTERDSDHSKDLHS
jgi:hypothetical protein